VCEEGYTECHFRSALSEKDIEDEVLHNWFEHFGVQFQQLHAFSHLNREQTGSLVNEVSTKKVFPLHTQNACLFKQRNRNVQLTKREEVYTM